MNYNQTLEFLFSSLVSYQEKGPEAYKPGLERITAFCKHLGNPQRNYFTIHVAGTNGKGSVSHMLASVLQQAGYRTGLYTSPHLRDFRERILVDGEMIPKQKVVNFVDKHYDCMKELGLSFFEMSTALAFDYFDQSDVEVAVIETGLGGRLDATNLIIPIVSVITNIGLDHMALLGDTLPKIAAEKAGIIKKSIPVVIGEKSDEYNHVFDQAATAMMSKIVYAENDFACINHSTEGDFQKFSIQRHRDNKVFNLELDLTGNYQVHNILTAIAVIDLPSVCSVSDVFAPSESSVTSFLSSFVSALFGAGITGVSPFEISASACAMSFSNLRGRIMKHTAPKTSSMKAIRL